MKEYSVVKCMSLATIFICTGLDCVLRPQLRISSILVIGALISLWMYRNIYKFGKLRNSFAVINQLDRRCRGRGDLNIDDYAHNFSFTWLGK